MVDKINRPDKINPYDVIPSQGAHEEKQRREQGRGEEGDGFQPGEEGAQTWEKFSTTASTRELLRINREGISQLLFRQSTLHSRAAILETDLILKNGTIYKHARIISPNLDDYWKWKGWMPGQVIPLELLALPSIIEVSIAKPITQRVPAKRTAPAVEQPKGMFGKVKRLLRKK